MTQQAQQKLEAQFLALRESYTSEQWTNSRFLFEEVKKLEASNIALACRLMQRVKNLDPSEDNQKYLNDLQSRTLKEKPELASVSSNEFGLNIIRKGKGITNQFKTILSNPSVKKYQKPFFLIVWLPFFLFAFYQIIMASPRYESQAKIIVKEPNGMATLDPSMALMSGFGLSSSSTDTELVKAFVHSNDMLNYLEENIHFSEHYSDTRYDIFSRLVSDASSEDKLSFYLKHVNIVVDEKSQVINISAQAFEPDFAHLLSKSIVGRAEWYINEIGHNLSKAQLKFVQQEHEIVEQKLQAAKSQLLAFQRQYDLLDPEAEGLAMQQITYKLEGEIANQKAELNALRSSMSNDAPLVMQANAQLNSLIKQLETQRARLTSQSNNNDTASRQSDELSVGVILARYSDFKINLELALQSYTSSQISLEKSRIEAYRQLKYLVVVESPTLPDDSSYPRVIYNLALFLCIMLMIFGIGKIISATVEELR
jgi:capsular polysaccharide transport system permease protein